jgi:hypothetical protein
MNLWTSIWGSKDFLLNVVPTLTKYIIRRMVMTLHKLKLWWIIKMCVCVCVCVFFIYASFLLQFALNTFFLVCANWFHFELNFMNLSYLKTPMSSSFLEFIVITTKGVHVRQVILLDFEWIHWSNECGLMNYTCIL